ncbi:MAG: tRNA pseudouridine(55) synthase TruB [bacterium]
MRGILNINKPAKISSYDVIRQIKPALKPKKIGHAGILDPLGTGVLLVLVNEATKISRLLLSLPKEYEAEIKFGIQTDTDDISGQTIATASVPENNPIEAEEILIQKFTGKIEQTPPRFSALKKSGTPLYKLARQGIEFTPRTRTVIIYQLKLIKWQPPFARLQCLVSSGTYIRSLARDIGFALNSRATLTQLVRKRIGIFTVENAIPLESFRSPAVDFTPWLIPIDRALPTLPRVLVTSEQKQALLNGKSISLLVSSNINPATVTDELLIGYTLQDIAFAFTDDNSFLALIKIFGNKAHPLRLIYAD